MVMVTLDEINKTHTKLCKYEEKGTTKVLDVLKENMINKINKEMRRSMSATLIRPSNKSQNRTGHKAEHGQAYH
jgi:hypothetical protein